MTAKLIDGTALVKEVREAVAAEVAALVAAGHPPPGLATVLVGEDPASEVYVGMKKRMCEKLGMKSFSYTLPADASQEEVEPSSRKTQAALAWAFAVPRAPTNWPRRSTRRAPKRER